MNYLPTGKECISFPKVGWLITTQLHFSHSNLYVNRSWMHKDIVLDSFLIFCGQINREKLCKECLFMYLFVCLLILRYNPSWLMALQPVISSMRLITLHRWRSRWWCSVHFLFLIHSEILDHGLAPSIAKVGLYISFKCLCSDLHKYAQKFFF